MSQMIWISASTYTSTVIGYYRTLDGGLLAVFDGAVNLATLAGYCGA